MSADGLGNVYISGYTYGSLGGPNAGGHDAFVSKYDAAGTLQWSRQLGTMSGDDSHGVSADGLGNVYISGYTGGSLGGPNAGSYDAFVSKYDAAGSLQWTRQLGTTSDDYSFGVSADGLGTSISRATPKAAWAAPTPAATTLRGEDCRRRCSRTFQSCALDGGRCLVYLLVGGDDSGRPSPLALTLRVCARRSLSRRRGGGWTNRPDRSTNDSRAAGGIA